MTFCVERLRACVKRLCDFLCEEVKRLRNFL